MRQLMLLGLLLAGCSHASVQKPVNVETNPKSELQQLEERLGV